MTPANYQVLLRIPIAGNAVTSSTILVPGTQSFVAAGPNGGAWVDGVLSAPLLPLTPLASLGTGFAVHVPAGAAIDQTARFGGLPNASPTYASLPAVLTSVAVDASDEPLIAGAIQPTASSGLLATETYDLPLRNVPTTALPSSLANAELTAATCSGSLCAGSAAYLAKLNPNASAASLAFSANALPFIVLRNLGSNEADNLQLTTSAGTLTSNCVATLYAGGECDILLAGGGAGSLTASSSNAGTQTVAFAAYSATAPTNGIIVSPKELDFGIQTSTSATATRVVTISNLGTASQTFASALDATTAKGAPASPFSQTATDCTLGANVGTYSLAAGGTCHITLGLTAPATASSDGLLNANWAFGGHDVLLTGYSQAAALSVSASEVDFGTQYSNGIRLPRYLFLSNASANPVSHVALSLPAGSAFTLTDGCPSILLADSICRVRIDYAAAKTPSTDSVTLTLDQGLSVLITGQTLPPQGVTGATVNPNLGVTPTSASFANAVAVTSISSATQTVTISNSGTGAFALTLALTGDFTDVTGCGATLAGGQSCTVVISFAPSQPGARQGLLSVTAGAGTSPAYVALTGTGAAILPANNGTLSSGSIAVGQPVTVFYKIAQPFTALSATSTGPFTVLLVEDAGFGPGTPAASAYTASSTGTCRNCYLGVQFTPSATGVQTGTLTLASTGSAYVLALTGVGLPTNGLLLTPLAQDFGTAPVYSSSGTQLFTLTNLSTSGGAVAVGTPAVSGDFAISTNPSGGAACGGTLAYAAACFVEVDFAPTATGSRTGTLTLTSSGGSASATLTGLAIADPGVAINPLALTFSNVGGGTGTTQTVTLTNTGAAAITIGTATVGTANFSPASTCGSLAAGLSCTIKVSFVPGSALVADTLSIPVTSTPGGTQIYTVALNGSYTAGAAGLEIVPAGVQYGPLSSGSLSATRLFTTNNLTSKTLTLNIVLPRQFVLSGAPCGGLAPNASCSFSLAFAPQTNNTVTGSIYVQGIPSDGSATLSSIAYAEGYGTGAGTLTVTGALIVNNIFNFGQVTSGQTLTQTFTLANSNPAGSPAITVRRVTSGPPFLSTSTCGTALAVGQTCSVTVTYAPSNQVATGTTSPAFTSDAGSLIIESDAVSSPNIINLTGQGAPVAVTSPANAASLASFSLSQSSLTFATTTVGNVSAPQTITLANTGTITIHVSGVLSAADFTAQNGCTTVVAGATCEIVVTATPQVAGTRLASLEIASDSGTSLEFVTLITTGSPSALSLSASALNFGQLLVGNSTTLPLQVINISANPVVFAGITATGDYTVSGTCPQPGSSLAAGQSCSEQVTFHPLATGSRNGTLSLGSSASTNPLTVALTGTGTQPELSISPSLLAFGTVALGTSTTQSVTLVNNGAASISNVSVSVTGDYAVSVPCAVSTLTAGASCAVQVTFTPMALGSRPGTLTVVSSDAGSPATIQLTGTGLQGGSFTLTVNGAASASATVTSGQPANYQLALTPAGGFAGAVALTCTPLATAQYASCSLLPSSVTLNGAQRSVATINTITSATTGEMRMPGMLAKVWLCLLFPGLLTVWRGRRNLRPHRKLLLALLLAGFSTLMSGCGGGSSTTSTGDPNARYTPAGTYQFQVAASSTSGVQVTQLVTLNLTVTAR